MSTFILNLPVHVFHSLAPAVGCLGIIELSLIRVLISEMAPPDKQGKIYRGGILSFIHCFNVTIRKYHDMQLYTEFTLAKK